MGFDWGLGAAAGKRVLAERLSDRSMHVRRLTLLAISRWRRAGHPHRPALRRLLRDRSPDVRATARSVLGSS